MKTFGKFVNENYFKGVSKSTASKKKAQMKKQADMDDDDPNAYKEMPGDTKGKKTSKTSKHTKKYHELYNESVNEFFSIDPDNQAAFIKKAWYDGLHAGRTTTGKYSLRKWEKFAKEHRIDESVNEGKKYEEVEWIAPTKTFDYFGTKMTIKKGEKGLLISHESDEQYLVEFQDMRFYAMDGHQVKKTGNSITESLNESFYPSTRIGAITNQKDLDKFDNDPFIRRMYKQDRIMIEELDVSYDDEWQIFIDKKDKEVIKFLKKNYPQHLQIDAYLANQLAESVNEADDDDKQSTKRGPIDGAKIEKALKTKSEETGVPIGIIRAVMRRGMAAWKTGHRPGATQEQWGYARVNAFLTKGEGTWGKADKDLAKEVRDGGHDKKLKK